MKLILCFLVTLCLVGCSSCAYRAKLYPLQPGDSVIFTTAERANEYRVMSLNDLLHTNRVVEITRPCALTAE